MANELVISGELGAEFDIGNIQSGKIRLKLGSGLSIQPDGTIVATLGSLPTTTVTEVRRSIFNLGTSTNINPNTAPFALPFLPEPELNEIGASLGTNAFKIPQGNYEININVNLDANGARPNFYFDLVDDSTGNIIESTTTGVQQTSYGHVYARNASGHDDTGQSNTFHIEVPGSVALRIETRREASAADVDLIGGWIIIRRYEQKTVLTP